MNKKLYIQPATEAQTMEVFAPMATSAETDTVYTGETGHGVTDTDDLLEADTRQERGWDSFEW